MVEGSSPEENPVPIPLIVQKMETLKARREDLELSELARRFEKIDTQEQVFKKNIWIYKKQRKKWVGR